jgi:hypothetical protein
MRISKGDVLPFIDMVAVITEKLLLFALPQPVISHSSTAFHREISDWQNVLLPSPGSILADRSLVWILIMDLSQISPLLLVRGSEQISLVARALDRPQRPVCAETIQIPHSVIGTGLKSRNRKPIERVYDQRSDRFSIAIGIFNGK